MEEDNDGSDDKSVRSCGLYKTAARGACGVGGDDVGIASQKLLPQLHCSAAS